MAECHQDIRAEETLAWDPKRRKYVWSFFIIVCNCVIVTGCAWFGLVIALLMVFLKNASMCIKKVKLINHDCLHILLLLYIMLYIVLAYLMLFAALSNAVYRA